MPPNPPPPQYPDRQEAQRFLSALDFDGRKDELFAFQTFVDDKSRASDEDGQLVTTPYGTLDQVWEQLANVNRRGAGVHVTIARTDGRGRVEENMVAPRAVFVDYDHGEPTKEDLAPLPVSMVVRSRRGPHVYWLLAIGENLHQWRRVQRALSAKLGADESATVYTQTMRVPGFWNHRTDPPLAVGLQLCRPERRYTLAEIVEAFGLEDLISDIIEEERADERRRAALRDLKPTRPISSYADRLQRALLYISRVGAPEGTGRNDHITKHVAPIGYGFGIEEHTWADEVVSWAHGRGLIARDFTEKEVRSIVRSIYRRIERKGNENFGWRLEQDSEEWKAKQAARERVQSERRAQDEALWDLVLNDPGQDPTEQMPARPSGAPPGMAVAREAFVPMPDPDPERVLHPAVQLLDLVEYEYRTPVAPDGHPLNVRGNAQRFLDDWRMGVRFCPPLKDWYVWDEKRWKKDDSNKSNQLAQQTVARIHQLLEHPTVRPSKDDSDEKKAAKEKLRGAIRGHLNKSESPRGVKELMEYASWQRSVLVMPDQLDADDLLFNCDNGVVDVRDLSLAPHNPRLYMTRVSPTAYVPKAKCPRWESFLEWAMGGDSEMCAFLQRAAGYSLTGSISEQKFFVCFGLGGNGKSTFITTLMEIAAGYARQCSFDMFLSGSHRSNGAPNEELLALKDVRLAFASEPDQGARLKEDLIKQITGGERISARPLWGKPVEFMPKFSLWFSCNHRPAIRGTDNGIWRRVVFIPWQQDIDATPEKKDLHLDQKLRAEQEGILAWAMAGAHAWYTEGLQIPERVLKATQGYRDDMDVLGDFLALKTIQVESASVGSSALYNAYREWCEQQNENAWKQKTFTQRLKERGFRVKKKRSGNVFEGIGLLDDKAEPHWTETDRDDEEEGEQTRWEY